MLEYKTGKRPIPIVWKEEAEKHELMQVGWDRVFTMGSVSTESGTTGNLF